MIKITILCSESPDVLIENIIKAANEEGSEVSVLPVFSDVSEIGKYQSNIILISPQRRYQKKDIEMVVGQRIPVAIINTVDYGMMDGRAVFNTVKKKLGKIFKGQ